MTATVTAVPATRPPGGGRGQRDSSRRGAGWAGVRRRRRGHAAPPRRPAAGLVRRAGCSWGLLGECRDEGGAQLRAGAGDPGPDADLGDAERGGGLRVREAGPQAQRNGLLLGPRQPAQFSQPGSPSGARRPPARPRSPRGRRPAARPAAVRRGGAGGPASGGRTAPRWSPPPAARARLSRPAASGPLPPGQQEGRRGQVLGGRPRRGRAGSSGCRRPGSAGRTAARRRRRRRRAASSHRLPSERSTVTSVGVRTCEKCCSRRECSKVFERYLI